MDNNAVVKEKRIDWNEHHEKLGGITLVEHLFKRLDIIFLGRFTAAFKTDGGLEEGLAVWSECLSQDRITIEEVKKGLEEGRRKKFPPSYGEFLESCRPKFDYFACFYEAIKGLTARKYGDEYQFTSPAIYHAAIEFGEHDIMTKAYSTCEKRWKELLDKHSNAVDVREIPKVLKALSFDRKARDKQKAGESIRKMKDILKASNSTGLEKAV